MSAVTRRGQVIALRQGGTKIEDLGDDALIAAVATGDRAARTLLFERYLPAVHRFIARMRGSDPDVVEDLVQATFVSAFQSASRFRGDNARAWLLGIAANHTRTYARGEIRRKRALVAVADEPSPRVDPGDVALLSRLPAAIESLPHDLRAAIVLVDLEGERGADAAAVLGIPEGTLWRRLFNARRAIRTALVGRSS
jgi:RNA polymerase sigma-70 factor, ECF subfamily